jgi:signal transduction histidine kinase
MRFNLSQKALLLVIVPLSFQLAFLYGVSLLLDQSERDVKVQAHAREVSMQLSDCFRLLLNAAAGITAYGYTRDKHFAKRYNHASDAVPDKLDALKELTKDDPEESKLISDMSATLLDTMDNFREVRKRVDVRDYFGALKRMQEVKPIIADMYAQFDAIVDLEQSIETSAPLTEQRYRNFLRRLLWASAFASVLIAVGATIGINRSTTSRLRVLVENTNRFASGKELLPPIKGHDEIAHLDAVFRDMARTVAEGEKLKRQFVSVISHELRTPLMNVQGVLELLQEGIYGDLNQNGSEQVDTAAISTERIMTLLNDLLSIDKLESGMLDLAPREMQIADVVARSVQIVTMIAAKKQITIDTSGVADAELIADPDRLIQVITNLLSNAIKYSGTETSIAVSTTLTDGMLRVAVKDQGRGIPADFIDHVFDRYVQVRESDSHVGTGLGLAICKAIIEQHGGRIGVSSEIGAGSEFWFELQAAVPAKEVVTTGHDSVTNLA